LLKYTPDHLWVKLDEDNHAIIGLTEEGINEFSELTSVRLPNEGDDFLKDQPFGRVAFGKGASFKLLAPVTGEILGVNEDIVDSPEAIMEDPYEEGWLVRMEVGSISEYDDLMTREEYEDYLLEDEDDDDEDEDDDDDGFFYDDDDDDDDEDDDEDDDDYYDDDDDEY
jgi:glycine cleavage system H protein